MLLAMSLWLMAGELSAFIKMANVGGGIWVNQVSSKEVKQTFTKFLAC